MHALPSIISTPLAGPRHRRITKSNTKVWAAFQRVRAKAVLQLKLAKLLHKEDS